MMAGADRPGARTLSKLFMRGQDGLPSLANRTALLAFFGNLMYLTNCNNITFLKFWQFLNMDDEIDELMSSSRLIISQLNDRTDSLVISQALIN